MSEATIVGIEAIKHIGDTLWKLRYGFLLLLIIFIILCVYFWWSTGRQKERGKDRKCPQ